MTDILTITAALNVVFFGVLPYVSGSAANRETVKRAAGIALAMMAINAVALSVALGLAR